MYSEIDTKHTTAVEVEIQSAYKFMFPQGDRTFVSRAFAWTMECFSGNHAGYQAIDARYHDFEHTLQGSLCLARLLRGRHAAGAQPPLTQKIFELGLLAILLHDTGYLKRSDDTAGTGAKYTLIHVNRSVDFAGELLGQKGFSDEEITAVQNMIRCTGVNVDLSSIPFQNELERTVGFALGTSDLLGQMAAKDYVEKLPILYLEFEESARHNDGRMTAAGSFSSAEELMRKTPLFWERYVLPKIQQDFNGLYEFLNVPYPEGANLYLRRIERNLSKLREKWNAPVS